MNILNLLNFCNHVSCGLGVSEDRVFFRTLILGCIGRSWKTNTSARHFAVQTEEKVGPSPNCTFIKLHMVISTKRNTFSFLINFALVGIFLKSLI